MDLIYRQELARRLATSAPEQYSGLVAHIISTAPTIEVEKHGRWIDPAAEDCYRCSVCEEYTHMEMPRLLYHYCPNCGSHMDGKGGGENG